MYYNIMQKFALMKPIDQVEEVWVMKLNKCFTTVFDSTLKEHGFKRKGVLYYRINGEVLQGITIKMTNPYSICCAFLPYWMYDILWNFHRGASIDKSLWAEAFDYLSGEYYRQDDENAIEYMQSLLAPVRDSLIPLLDKISSNDHYLRTKEYYLDPGSRLTSPIIPQYALMQKALEDHSFEESDRLLQKSKDYCIAFDLWDEEESEEESDFLRERYEGSYLDTLPHIIQPYLQKVEELKQSEDEYAAKLKGLDRMMEVHYKEYSAIREKEDFDAIAVLYAENNEKMKKDIKEKLKIEL